MKRKPMALEQIKESCPKVNRIKVAATAEEDIRRHQIEDEDDLDTSLSPFHQVLVMQTITKMKNK